MRRISIRKDICFLLFAACALLATLLCLFFGAKRSYGHICVYAVDAYSGKAVEGAVVILPESGMQAQTDSDGKAMFFHVPVEKNPLQNRLLEQDFGQSSILCYKEGYHPYALFYAQIPKARVREGPTLYLFPEGTQAGCVIEAPPEGWVEELIKLYDPF